MMRELRVREAVLRTGTTSRGNRQLRRPCAPRVFPGHRYHPFTPRYTFGHAQSRSDPHPRGPR
eukprot:6387789-Prymnesium_polylepis.1